MDGLKYQNRFPGKVSDSFIMMPFSWGRYLPLCSNSLITMPYCELFFIGDIV